MLRVKFRRDLPGQVVDLLRGLTMDPSVTAEEVQAKRPPRPEDDYDDEWGPVFVPCRICPQPVAEQGMNCSDPRFPALFLEKWNKARPDLHLDHWWGLHALVADRLRDYDATGQPGWEAPLHQPGWSGRQSPCRRDSRCRR